ncbi:ABC transporter substrate-binding protein [[Phormidium ambiguum] IAM M-71]|uniref:ABC transporter substrate-binding protein n=1 Tax=[Phormidium ambiguum] IAM M-71 TaxID=454136 RepID=A0A1U7IBS8_9CYAN|nr:glycine betaine ABC transporter substrate-binding protein [Phormidium ambiguum]OKH34062.1 ABC transporter substrate-binding protein [Phormidium ambiguum IAM M-71]
MKKRNFVLLCVLGFSLAMLIASCTVKPDNLIIIGSKNFTEQKILGELLAQHIEANTDLKVERKLNLGDTFICHNALTTGEIDAYVEYTGTAFTAILNNEPLSNPQEVYQQTKQQYEQQFNVEVMPSLGFNNTFAIVIRGEDARKLQVQSISEIAQKTPLWRVGFGEEFLNRKDGFSGLAETYNLRFAESPKVMDVGRVYPALKNKQVDLVVGNSTDGQIGRLDLVVLKDDRLFFPPYQAVPVVRQQTLQKHPELREVFQKLSGKISAPEMQRLNLQVEVEKKDVKQVVEQFLLSKGLIKK